MKFYSCKPCEKKGHPTILSLSNMATHLAHTHDITEHIHLHIQTVKGKTN